MNNNELLSAISALLDRKFESELHPIKTDIQEIKTDVKDLKIRVGHLEDRMDRLETKMDGLETRMDKLEVRIDGLEVRVDRLETKVGALDQRVIDIELHLENVTDKNISILAENYLPATKRFMKASAWMETMQTDIELLKKVVTDHSQRLQLQAL